MKILKHGEIPSTVKRFECEKCHCIFECEKDEYQRYTAWNRTYSHATCPECGANSTEVIVKEEKISMAHQPARKLLRINSEILYSAIKAKTSIRKLGPEIGYSEKTIRRALKEGVISVNLAFRLSTYLQIGLSEFVICVSL